MIRNFLFLSLMFERAHGWTGLLVEPHPTQFFKVANSQNLFGWRAKLGLSDLPLKDKSNKSKFIFFFLGFACSEEGLECCHLPGHCNKVKCWKSMLVQRRRGGERDCFHSPEQPSCWNSIAGRTSVGSPWKWPRERWLALYRTVGREMVSWRQLLWYF